MQRVVLITGASSGMGAVTAKTLADAGYKVYAGYRSGPAGYWHENIKELYLDVTDTESIGKAVDIVMQNEGRIDVLVNNAGYGLLATLEDGTDKEIFDQFNVNVFGLIKTTRAVLPHMRRARGGVIVNISSFLGKMGLPLLSHYTASKYAVEGIVDALRFETLPFNIRVHSVQAGLFGTNFVKKGLVVNQRTMSKESPYRDLAAHFVPTVARAINEGPNPRPIADTIKYIIENEDADIFIPVGEPAAELVPLRKELDDKAFEAKVKEIFSL